MTVLICQFIRTASARDLTEIAAIILIYLHSKYIIISCLNAPLNMNTAKVTLVKIKHVLKQD